MDDPAVCAICGQEMGEAVAIAFRDGEDWRVIHAECSPGADLVEAV